MMLGRTVGHYRITDRLGGGGMGVVYRAEDVKLGRTVALKFLPPELTRDPEAKHRFEREAKAASQLDHPNICTVYDFGEADDGQMYLAMACYDGESLHDKVARGPMPLDEALPIVEQIARGLGKAHASGIVHRDIKPDNVIVTRDGVVKILDFGLAKISLASKITKSHTTLGTAAYMAPEQLRGEEVGPQADIWALGVVLYELLTARLPFAGEYMQALAYSILNEQPASLPDQPRVDRIVKRMLRKDPLRRYQTSEELLQDLKPLKKPSLVLPAQQRIAAGQNRLKSAARLGPYEIVRPIGTDVYLARDARLDRQVTVKVLPPELTENAKRKERFKADAKAISQLTHPNICTLFDVGEQDGVDYVVTEFIDGETLDEQKMPLPVPRVLKIGAQIADGLAAAHKQGIVHRNLKPSNVMITKSGAVKLLDFGLAKDVAAIALRNRMSGAVEAVVAREEKFLSSIHCMAPEQLQGKEAGPQSDIFALGILLYEMTTGRPAFSGTSRVGLIAAILERDPQPSTELRAAIPPALDRLIRACIEKNPDERMQTAHDVMLQLRSMADIVAPPVRQRLPSRAAIAVVAVLAAAAGGFTLSRGLGGGGSSRPRTFTQLTFTEGLESFPTLAPDGKSFAYVSSQSGNRDIYLQRVDGRTAINLTSDSPSDDSEPAFSPDGSQIAFRSERNGGGIFVMGVTGESVRRLTDFGHNPSWSANGARVVVCTVGVDVRPQTRTVMPGELWLIDARTGAKQPLVKQGTGGPEFGLDSDAVQPSWSPHGHRIAFWGLSDRHWHRDIWTIDPDAPQPKRTAVRATTDPALHWNPVWSPDGKSLYFGSNRDGTLNLWRVAIDEATGKTAGAPEPLSLPAAISGNFSVSREGVLAYVAVTRTYRVIALPFDAKSGRTGAPRPLFGSSQEIVDFQFSPDRRTVAFTAGSGGTENLFLANADGTRMRRLTNDAARDRVVKWSPDGQTLYIYSNRDGPYQIWSIQADGSGLTRVTGGGNIYLSDVSPDGRTLAAQTDRSLALVHLDRPAANRVETIAFTMEGPNFSPDGGRLAGHINDPRGGPAGIAVYSIPTGRHEKVLDHGVSPLWLPDGRHLGAFDQESISILDLNTHQATTTSFPALSGVRLNDTTASPRLSSDGSTLYVRQTLEQGNIWMVNFEK
jgi:serine/threonine protein kinase/sugar lactone lactonase YvrE